MCVSTIERSKVDISIINLQHAFACLSKWGDLFVYYYLVENLCTVACVDSELTVLAEFEFLSSNSYFHIILCITYKKVLP